MTKMSIYLLYKADKKLFMGMTSRHFFSYNDLPKLCLRSCVPRSVSLPCHIITIICCSFVLRNWFAEAY